MTSGGEPVPVLPEFDGASLPNVVASLLAAREGAPAGDGRRPWVPAVLEGARQVVLLVLDGLGWEQLNERRGLAPTITSGEGGPITSVAPSTTACALASLVTGAPPAVHGLLGYRLCVNGEVMNVLRWQLGEADARSRLPARSFQGFPPFPSAGGPVPVVTRSEFAATGFTAAHLGDSVLHAYSNPSGLAVEVERLVRAGEPFVYAYYDGVDRVSHACGLGAHYDAELTAADRLVGDVLAVLPPDAVLVVTADHGQVEVGQRGEVLGPDVMDGVTLLSGEGRFRWLHTRPGATDDVAAAARVSFGHLAWVRTREEVIEAGWLGGEPVPSVAERLGDVALVPFEPTAFLDPADTREQLMVGRHGSLTAEEMLVPLLAWRPE
jgi:Type I phosphodiesterase / nucleotide pyrophosphatase